MAVSRFFILLLVAVLGLSAGCRRVTPPGGASGSKPDAARKQAETLALDGITGAAEVQSTIFVAAENRRSNPDRPVPLQTDTPSAASAPGAPQPKALPRPGPVPIIRERVVNGVPAASEADADREAILAAQEMIERRLAELDPPVKYRPSINEVEKEFLRRDSKSVTFLRDIKDGRAEDMRKTLREALGLSPEEIARRAYVEYDVEITADQVRHLRTRDRVGDTLRIFGALASVALAGFLFLRADEWTKGYLTRWLAMAAVLLAGGAAAALYFV
jgi:hypothetical protein